MPAALVFAALMLAQALPVHSTTAPTTPKPASKLKCISTEVTGSLARRVRVCHTPEEWDRLRDRTQDDAGKLLDNHINSCGATQPGGC